LGEGGGKNEPLTTTEGQNVLDAVLLAHTQGLVDLLLAHVGAGQVHARLEADELGRIGADVERGLQKQKGH